MHTIERHEARRQCTFPASYLHSPQHVSSHRASRASDNEPRRSGMEERRGRSGRAVLPYSFCWLNARTTRPAALPLPLALRSGQQRGLTWTSQHAIRSDQARSDRTRLHNVEPHTWLYVCMNGRIYMHAHARLTESSSAVGQLCTVGNLSARRV